MMRSQKMALNELAWRKFPRDTMKNEELDYVSFLLGKELAAAPFLFFTTAYCKADDDGVIDVGDGVIFARLMRLGTPQDVIKVANMLEERKILTRVVPDQNVFLITDWEVPARPGNLQRKALTADERRSAVAAKIRAEQKVKTQQSQFLQNQNKPDDFSCPDFDKIRENVATQREREEIERGDRETHTQERGTNREIERDKQREGEGLRANGEALQPYAQEIKQEQKELEEVKTTNLAEIALQEDVNTNMQAEKNIKNKESTLYVQACIVVSEVLCEFFAKNCLGFDQSEHEKDLEKLTMRLAKLADDKNKPEIVASVFCSQFKLLAESPGYFNGMPLIPERLANSEVYAVICRRAQKILAAQNASQEWIKQQKAEQLEILDEKEYVYDFLKAEAVKYGIDPNSGDLIAKLVVARKNKN